jgi:hypothetical protein
MSTPTTPHPTDLGRSAPHATARALFAGLAWGGVMLFMFRFWILAKHGDSASIVANIVGVAGGAALALALWQAFTLWFKADSPEQKIASLNQQRQLFSYVLLFVGLGLIVLAFYLGIGKRSGATVGFIRDNLAESIGALFLGLIALGSGYYLTLQAEASGSPIAFLSDKVPLLKLIMIVLAVVSLGTFIYIIYRGWVADRGIDVPVGDRSAIGSAFFVAWLPELFALVFFSVLCVGCLLWLNSGDTSETNMRMFVLIFGGATGVILFFMALGRTFTWREDILYSGSAGWQGENAWHFWLCAYLLCFSLVLMFASFNLARTDIRKNAALRRLLYGYDAVAQCLLLVGILIVLNIVVYALMPFTFDWTQARGAYALADSTRNTVMGLKKDISAYVLMSPGAEGYKDVRLLMENAHALNNKLTVHYLSPDTNPAEFDKLARMFPKLLPDSAMGEGSRGVLLVAGPLPTREKQETPQYAFVPNNKIFEVERPRHKEEKPKQVFKGESEIIRELRFLLQDRKKHKIYVLQGNGELDMSNMQQDERPDFTEPNSTAGFGFFMKRLEIDNYEASGLSFEKELGKKAQNIVLAKQGVDKKKHIPDDCEVLIIPGPSKKIPEETLDAIERYLDRGGRAMAFLGVVLDTKTGALVDTGLEGLLRRYGVETSGDVVLRFPVHETQDDVRRLFVVPNRSSENVLAREFSQTMSRDPIVFRRAGRTLKAAEGHGKFRAEAIAHYVSGRPEGTAYAVVKKADVLPRAQSHMIEMSKDPAKRGSIAANEPIPAIIAVSEGEKPRLLVFAGVEPISNLDQARFKSGDIVYAFVVSGLEWMGERESIGAQPKVTQFYQVSPTLNRLRMYNLPAWLMLLTVAGLGVGVWVVRRR